MICDLSDLPVEQCACRLHGPKEAPVSRTSFEAKFAGWCDACNERINRGDLIQLSPHAIYVHAECAE